MYDIHNLFLFRDMPDDERDAVAASFREIRSFERGEVIYDDAHFSRAIGVFLEGKGYAGDENATKASFGPSDVFGAAAVFGAGERYVSRIVARTACRVLFIREDALRRLMVEHPICAINYVTFLSERIRYLNHKIAQYTEGTAANRLLRLLCDKADANRCVADINMSSLASLSGMGRTSAYRALAELEETGVIRWEKENKNIYIIKETLS